MNKSIWLYGLILIFTSAKADDGYRLWLKYDKIQNAGLLNQYKSAISTIYSNAGPSPVLSSAVQELKQGLEGLLGKQISSANSLAASGQIILSIVKRPSALKHEEGYRLYRDKQNIRIDALSDRGLLYGSFAFLRLIQSHTSLEKVDIVESPKINIRLLNHWDNVNGTIERGYAGASLWKWYDLPEVLDPRYTDYARANASIGINGTVVNNVNASARFLDRTYMVKVAALANVFRKYGIKTYMSVRFTAPIYLGGLKTADPLDPAVREWWKNKVNEIYSFIPDFGGFLVKANSEGEPGPQDYQRTHADGANMLAEALEPHHGIVMWRAFVYKANPKNDRASESFNEFKPLDGVFLKNVIVQVKNGPIDFQPREPFHPLFGAMPKTPLMMEFQITQEYLGFATHWVYLANLFKEALESDTYVSGKGSTVARIIDGSIHSYPLTGIAGVANTGSDRNWCGHIGNQANWYVFGRLAWNPDLNTDTIADEWIRMTLTNKTSSATTIKALMKTSHEACVNYMTPLGLHHIMGEGIHFGPQPWLAKSGRSDWTSTYYHRADSIGLGFDRTSSGSNALNLYSPEVQKMWANPNTIPLKYLLWFHHIPWDQTLSTGNTLWEELCLRYYSGVKQVDGYMKAWSSVKNDIDPEIFTDIENKLKRQYWEAEWWKDACLLYFQTYSNKRIPAQYPGIKRSMEEIKKIVEVYQLR